LTLGDVRIFYLEMNSPKQLVEKPPVADLIILEAEIKEFRFNQYLYRLIGESWQWVDKLNDSPRQWQAHVERPQLRTWVAYYKGTIAGYFELEIADNGDVEILYFGLAPKFIGQGFGGYLLSTAVKHAWQLCQAKRVCLNTCSLDHPRALANYQACGFQLYTQTA
jgi:GNAT superfamily N-acetyltransferase